MRFNGIRIFKDFNSINPSKFVTTIFSQFCPSPQKKRVTSTWSCATNKYFLKEETIIQIYGLFFKNAALSPAKKVF
jgi:hypothetical protein